ncbi:MAG: acyl-CoA dehydrogenase family protein, partial [Mycobacteriaceae bacterium]|nr:acyl-CoA dehydrogenase family protein [Mycobacteriaceae bacterium]
MSFSMELPEEVVHVRDWVHEFAEEVIRPAAAEWDEREETPWPIIAEAAKVGLYTPELFAQMAGEPSGVGLLTVFEEMFWGDAGIALSILGTGLAAAALAASGTPEQLGEFLPQMFGSPGDPQVAAFCSSEPGAGSDVGAVRTRARYDETTGEWVLNGTKT